MEKLMLYELIEKTKVILASTHWPIYWPGELQGELVTLALLVCFVTLSNLELRFPKLGYTSWQKRLSYQTNISLFVLNSVVITMFSVATLLTIAERYSSSGLLSDLSSPALKALISLLGIDLMLYLWHQACHRFDFLWLFHRVHHSDSSMNVSTAFRLHFVEIMTTTCLKVLLIVTLGIDKMLVLTIESLMLLGSMFHHTNTCFRYERILSYMMIVPFLHRLHHSSERSDYNYNYGTIFSFWDRLFGTLSIAEPERIGLKNCPPENVLNLLKFGFGWNVQVCNNPPNLDLMIAEAAFYKAEKRNFCPGNELRDWLEAKSEILRDKVINPKRNHFV
jgi:sterol desaturase/sphingolipid hydroxylase (fatty acid hydroxylase superfamily)